MSSKKANRQKSRSGVNPPPKHAGRKSDFTKRFGKDWKRLTHSGRYDMDALREVVTLLISSNLPLPPEYLDHPLKGDWKGFRECHVGGDFLLVYRIEDDTVIFVAAGTHADLFE